MSQAGQQRQLFRPPVPDRPTPKYVYRARFYPEPPADWPAPKEACHRCSIQRWPPSWKWTGYEWACTRRHE